MESLKIKLNEFQVHTCVCYGHVNEEVVRYEKNNSVDLIVMGTHGATGIKQYISGSHAEYVAMHANAPVFTVKCDRSKMEIKSIAFTNSFESKEIEFPKVIQDIQESFNAQLHLLRVNTSKSFMSDEIVLENMKYFTEQHQLKNVKYAVINDDEVETGIEKYCMYNSIDVISIGSNQRTGINKLINGCVSADLVNHVFKPIITFKK
jgi:nucleotide-binding universal stress UspA family protein